MSSQAPSIWRMPASRAATSPPGYLPSLSPIQRSANGWMADGARASGSVEKKESCGYCVLSPPWRLRRLESCRNQPKPYRNLLTAPSDHSDIAARSFRRVKGSLPDTTPSYYLSDFLHQGRELVRNVSIRNGGPALGGIKSAKPVPHFKRDHYEFLRKSECHPRHDCR